MDELYVSEQGRPAKLVGLTQEEAMALLEHCASSSLELDATAACGIAKLADFCRDYVKSDHVVEAKNRVAKYRAQLFVAEERFQKLADFCPFGIFQTDRGGAITWVNRTFSLQTKLSLEDVAGDKWLKFIHPEDRNRAYVSWKQSVLAGSPIDVCYRVVTASGTITPGRAVANPILDEKGRVLGYIGTTADAYSLEEFFRICEHLGEA